MKATLVSTDCPDEAEIVWREGEFKEMPVAFRFLGKVFLFRFRKRLADKNVRYITHVGYTYIFKEDA